MNKDKKIKALIYEVYEPRKDKFVLGMPLNFYLSDISAVMESSRSSDCVVNLTGHLFIIEYPYSDLIQEWENFKTV